MRKQLVEKFKEYGEEEAHGWSAGGTPATVTQFGVNHPFATEAMCLEMTYSG